MVATVSFHEMLTDCRIFVLSNALMKVSGCVADLICIAQITWEMINSALSIQNWRLVFFGFKILYQYCLLAKTGCNGGRILWLRSRNCFRTALAVLWSLNGRLILTMLAQRNQAVNCESGTQPDTFINALLSTNIRQSVDISWKLTVATTSWKKTNLEF